MLTSTDFGALEILAFVAAVVLISFYITDPCHLRKCRSTAKVQIYSYSGLKGPSYWKQKYSDSNGANQSPINISQYTMIIPAECEKPLIFSEEYNLTPTEMTIYNDGYSVIVYVRWDSGKRPTITGGPCTDMYEFLNGRFRWGLNNDEGSEHTINCKAFAMEFQAIHIKCGKQYKTLSEAAEDNAVLIVSYFYETAPLINPYLQPLITALPKVKNPHICSCTEPIPLFFLMPSFVCKYVSYFGSLTQPPCTEGVQWIIQTEPLGIAPSQVEEFRKLYSFAGNLLMNRRPVQSVNGRDIFFYD
ncbi:hypothetical protein FQR65_LT03993 [Abscondita terminalis]|nr:hypothetical protein FQR65_LT03993 [Abscondita terminalis]